PSTPATFNGDSASSRCVRRGKYCSTVLPLNQVAPSPGRRITRATEVLRLPVPWYWAASAVAITSPPAAAALGPRADARSPHTPSAWSAAAERGGCAGASPLPPFRSPPSGGRPAPPRVGGRGGPP